MLYWTTILAYAGSRTFKSSLRSIRSIFCGVELRQACSRRSDVELSLLTALDDTERGRPDTDFLLFSSIEPRSAPGDMGEARPVSDEPKPIASDSGIDAGEENEPWLHRKRYCKS